MALDRTQVVQRIFTCGKEKKITLAHIPTGIRVNGVTEKSQMKLIEELLMELEKAINVRGGIKSDRT